MLFIPAKSKGSLCENPSFVMRPEASTEILLVALNFSLHPRNIAEKIEAKMEIPMSSQQSLD